jgi:hypothetical protein
VRIIRITTKSIRGLKMAKAIPTAVLVAIIQATATIAAAAVAKAGNPTEAVDKMALNVTTAMTALIDNLKKST